MRPVYIDDEGAVRFLDEHRPAHYLVPCVACAGLGIIGVLGVGWKDCQACGGWGTQPRAGRAPSADDPTQPAPGG